MTVLTDRFTRAVDYARVAHGDQVRKGSDIPYLSHLLGVASLVIDFGGNEDEAIAGLLHDLIEDCGTAHGPIIKREFGERVFEIVHACTDGTAEGKQVLVGAEAKRLDWVARKQAYLAHLSDAPGYVLLVSACDKLHNARAIVQDLEDPDVGHKVFERFKGRREGTLGYYQSLSEIFARRGAASARSLGVVVARMHDLAANGQRKPLGATEPDL
jgi:(p)ppGpp synthase/HD superfamily hydrolase